MDTVCVCGWVGVGFNLISLYLFFFFFLVPKIGTYGHTWDSTMCDVTLLAVVPFHILWLTDAHTMATAKRLIAELLTELEAIPGPKRITLMFGPEGPYRLTMMDASYEQIEFPDDDGHSHFAPEEVPPRQCMSEILLPGLRGKRGAIVVMVRRFSEAQSNAASRCSHGNHYTAFTGPAVLRSYTVSIAQGLSRAPPGDVERSQNTDARTGRRLPAERGVTYE